MKNAYRGLGLVAAACFLAFSASAGDEGAGASTPSASSLPLVTPASTAGSDLGGYFQRGNQAYLDGDYSRAIAEYRRVLDAGVMHPDLYFNVGNAYYRAGQKGMAVLFYEKALDLDPNDTAARSNLAMVEKELIDRVVMPESGPVGEPPWHGFIRGISIGWLTWFFLGLYGSFFGILIWRKLTSNNVLHRLLFWFSIPILIVTVVFGIVLGSRISIQEMVHHGVVVSSRATLREGPDRDAKVLMEVHEGLKVQLISEVGDFSRVRLQNGVEGFLLRDQFGAI